MIDDLQYFFYNFYNVVQQFNSTLSNFLQMPINSKSGIFLINKPLSTTSRDVLNFLQKSLHTGPLGHTGTLDPLATGLLVVLVGKARKLQDFFTHHNKKYLTTINLEAFSETDDAQGPFHSQTPKEIPDISSIKKCVSEFKGEIWQTPPQYSAIKIKGKRAHQLAREGKKADIASRKITIYNIDILDYQYPLLSLEVTCGSGTYIRSLARDIGTKLQTGGYVQSLQRTHIYFDAQKHFSLEQALAPKNTTWESLLTLEQVLAGYERVDLPLQFWDKVCNGQKISIDKEISQPAFIWIEGRVVAMAKTEGHSISTKKLMVTQD